MPYRFSEVQTRSWPDQARVDEALGPFGLSIETILGAMGACEHPAAPRNGVGFQLDLGPTIERHLSKSLATNGLSTASTRYSRSLNENADLALGFQYDGSRIFFELEFRPNVEKDLVKFQIGANAGSLAVGVLILTLDRNTVNPSYTTMPEFGKFERVISELAPTYPLLMVGFRGVHG